MIKALGALSGILDKAAKHADSKKTSWAQFEESLLQSRLVFDQFPFVRQVQIVCDSAKGTAGRLAEIEQPKFEDNEKTIADLQERINKTLAFLKTIKPEQVIGKEGIKVSLPYWPDKYMTGFEYVTEYSIGNFFFHMTTAYSILRKNGVEIGKDDYRGQLPLKDL